jgi:hypothetical protein
MEEGRLGTISLEPHLQDLGGRRKENTVLVGTRRSPVSKKGTQHVCGDARHRSATHVRKVCTW